MRNSLKIFSIGLLLMAFFFAEFAYQEIRVRLRMVENTAVILNANMESRFSDADEARTSRFPLVTRGLYTPRIHYRYWVNSTWYESDRYSISEFWTWNRSWAEEIVGHYASGERVPIWYDPENPSYAVLSPRLSALKLTVPAVFLIGALFVLVVIFRRKEHEAPSK